MLLVDEGCLQLDLVGADRIVPVASALQAEILTLRHQLNVLRRKSPQRLTFSGIDRLVFSGLYRLDPGHRPDYTQAIPRLTFTISTSELDFR